MSLLPSAGRAAGLLDHGARAHAARRPKELAIADTQDLPLGTLHTSGGGGAVRIEVDVAATPTDAWNALTVPDRLADWLGSVSGDLSTGGAFVASFRVSGWDGAGRVEACEPGRRFVVATWEHDDPVERTTEVTVRGDGGPTRVVVLQRELPLEQLAAYGAGLQLHVEDLVAHLGGRADRTTVERWTRLHPGYQSLAVLDDREC